MQSQIKRGTTAHHGSSSFFDLLSDCSCGFFQPCFLILIQIRGNLLIYLRMIIIKKFSLMCGHLLRNHGIKVKWYHSQELKAHKLAELCLFCFFAHDHVLMADSVSVFYIVSRLVRCDHAFFQHCIISRNYFPAEAVWSFMDIQQIADPMSGSVIKILSQFPQRPTCQIIQIYTCASLTEFRISQIQHTT